MEITSDMDTADEVTIEAQEPVKALWDVRNQEEIELAPFAGSTVTVGRSESCTITVWDDRLVSSLHCAIVIAEDLSCTLIECGAHNGTRVNLVRLGTANAIPLLPKTSITIGKREFRTMGSNRKVGVQGCTVSSYEREAVRIYGSSYKAARVNRSPSSLQRAMRDAEEETS